MDPVWKESSAWRDTEYVGGGGGGGWGPELQTVFEGLRQSFFLSFFFFLWCILFCPI